MFITKSGNAASQSIAAQRGISYRIRRAYIMGRNSAAEGATAVYFNFTPANILTPAMYILKVPLVPNVANVNQQFFDNLNIVTSQYTSIDILAENGPAAACAWYLEYEEIPGTTQRELIGGDKTGQDRR